MKNMDHCAFGWNLLTKEAFMILKLVRRVIRQTANIQQPVNGLCLRPPWGSIQKFVNNLIAQELSDSTFGQVTLLHN